MLCPSRHDRSSFCESASFPVESDSLSVTLCTFLVVRFSLYDFCLLCVCFLICFTLFQCDSAYGIFLQFFSLSHLHHVMSCHSGNMFVSLYFQMTFYLFHNSMPFCCHSDASFAVVSIENAMFSARSNVKTFSVSNHFCVLSLCMPHTSLSLNASDSPAPNWQCSDIFLSSAMYFDMATLVDWFRL